MITYLYHKRHKQTGLNYFGKTIRDPYSYKGSGIRWCRHLLKHGDEVETVQVWEFSDIVKCSEFAIEFSTRHNIVESINWANLRVENGLDGGHTPGAYTPEARLKKGAKLKGRIYSKKTLALMSLSHIGMCDGAKNPMYGRVQTDSTKQLISEKALNREKIICAQCGKATSPSNHTRWHGPECQKEKPISAAHRANISAATKGKPSKRKGKIYGKNSKK